VTETQKEYQRLEDEKFALLQFDCKWRTTPRITGKSFCLATSEICEKSTDCAVWHFLKGVGAV